MLEALIFATMRRFLRLSEDDACQAVLSQRWSAYVATVESGDKVHMLFRILSRNSLYASG